MEFQVQVYQKGTQFMSFIARTQQALDKHKAYLEGKGMQVKVVPQVKK